MSLTGLGVMASGRGSNFQAIIDAVATGYLKARVCLLVTDSAGAYAIERAKNHGIPSRVMVPKDFGSRDDYYRAVAAEMKKAGVDLILLAGFMRIVGKPLIDAFPHRVMNIHPALLPSFPGLHGQRQAYDYGVKISGCTVHFVDEGMDTGPIIIQAAVPAGFEDTEETLSSRILALEHRIYPEAVKLFIEGRLEVRGRKVFVKGAAAPAGALVSPPLSGA